MITRARKLFDAEFYLRVNPDVSAARMDPFQHYVKYGAAEQRQPHPLFDPAHYLASCPEARSAGNPLLHFLESRPAKWATTHALFDCDAYAALRPGVNPLADYIQQGSPAALEGSQFGQC